MSESVDKIDVCT